MFSILANEFKDEIQSPDDLLYKIKHSPISPQPQVKTLDFIHNWKDFCLPHLDGGSSSLKNHTMYNSFQWSKENGLVKFRGKLLPQDHCSRLGPKSGIQILLPGVSFADVGIAPFRIEKLELNKVFSSLQKFFARLHGSEKMNVVSSWEKLRDAIKKTLLFVTSPEGMAHLEPNLKFYIYHFE